MPAVCDTCNDTHRMEIGDRTVMCTRCPTPCQACRVGGNGPYCEHTPCTCGCHAKRSYRIGTALIAPGTCSECHGPIDANDECRCG